MKKRTRRYLKRCSHLQIIAVTYTAEPYISCIIDLYYLLFLLEYFNTKIFVTINNSFILLPFPSYLIYSHFIIVLFFSHKIVSN